MVSLLWRRLSQDDVILIIISWCVARVSLPSSILNDNRFISHFMNKSRTREDNSTKINRFLATLEDSAGEPLKGIK